MSFSVKRDDCNLTAALRRISQDQIDRALASLTGTGDRGDTIHDARKRMKKLRGLIRLVRPKFDRYKAENADLRDTARLLSPLRDRTAMIETYDRITGEAQQIDRTATAPLRRHLTIEARAALEAPQAEDRIREATDRLRRIRQRSEDWTVGGKGFKAAAKGMTKTMSRAQDAMQDATRTHDPRQMHQWRKRVKYHWYHLRLLKRSFPPLTRPHVDLADELSEILGDHHDLHVFEAFLDEAPISQAARADLSAAITDRRKKLEAKAERLGPALLAGDAKAFASRWRSWAETWPASLSQDGPARRPEFATRPRLQAASLPSSASSISAMVSSTP